ncbi:MAG: methionine--tRNA ligase [Candidatus Woesearchaeota archaeon]
MKRILVTSALPYINNVPHLGNLIGAVLSADVYARHKRLQGNEVLYVCGADEHGSATEKKAAEEKITPQELCDKYEAIHKELYDYFNISFDVWGRTHTQEQEEIVHELFNKLDANGYIFEKEVEQLYDEKAQMFLADRFVEGTCPYCQAAGARGDQCDACQQLINAAELINPISKITGTTPVLKKTKHLFLDLPKLAPLVHEWIGENPSWSENAKKFTQEFLKEIKPRAITRDLSWGVPVPKNGYENKVFYVWFDAPIGYISITKAGREDWKEWWSKETTLAQFMGKDNTLFHSVIFPAILLGADAQYTTVQELSVTEYLNLKDSKFSKSKQTGIFANDVEEIEKTHNIPVDAWRYSMLANRPETSDTNFSFTELQNRLNNELVDNLGNLVHRTTHFAHNKTQKTPLANTPSKPIQELIRTREELSKQALTSMDERRFREALHTTMKLAKEANAAFQHAQPWKSIQEEPSKAARDIHELLLTIRDLSILLHPFIPETSKQIQEQLGLTNLSYKHLGEQQELDVQEPSILFTKLLDETVHELTMKYTPPTHPLNLQAATILDVRNHPNADKLYLINIDLGSEQRQLVAGLKEHYEPEELQGKTAVVITNLQKATIRGETSQGMLLASEDKQGRVGLLLVNAQPGETLHIENSTSNDKELAFNEFTKLTITSNKEGVTIDGNNILAEITVDKQAYGNVR